MTMLRPSRRAAAGLGLAALAFLLALSVWRDARAGGDPSDGHSHGEEAPAAAVTGGPLIVTQDVQFALGLLTVLADTQAVGETFRLQGFLAPAPGADAVVSSPQPGRLVAARLPQVGQLVRAGQSFGTVEGALAAPDVAGLRADRADAEADVAQARADLTRLRALARVVAGKEIEAAEIRLQGAEARLNALSGALGAGNRYAITAPISGVVAEVTAAPGQQVEPGQPLIRIVDLGRLQVAGRAFERDLGRLRDAGGRAVVTSEAFDADFPARLLAVGPVVDPETRTVEAVFEVENVRGLLRSGQAVNVDVALGGERPRVVVPKAAVVRDEAGAPAVFVHPTPEGFVRRRVTLGPEAGDGFVVESGLQAGERVVVEGAYSLRGQ
jgi:cobalt-zinc-cadmium efflux system membrane fusion protein